MLDDGKFDDEYDSTLTLEDQFCDAYEAFGINFGSMRSRYERDLKTFNRGGMPSDAKKAAQHVTPSMAEASPQLR